MHHSLITQRNELYAFCQSPHVLHAFTFTNDITVTFRGIFIVSVGIACVASVSARVRRESWEESKKRNDPLHLFLSLLL